MRGLLFLLLAAAVPLRAEERVVSGSGSITETICALGAHELLVAVDLSSVYPESIAKLPKVGYARQLSAEGILSMNPTLLIVTEDAGPPEVLKQVESAGVRIVSFSNEHTPDAAETRILRIGEELNRTKEAGALAAKLRADLEQTEKEVSQTKDRPRVMFIYARGGGVMNVSGTGTSADAMIALGGGVNAVQDYRNYKPLTAEGAAAAAPDVILVTTRGLQSSGGRDGLLKQPGIALTPAGRTGQIIAMDDLFLLGFGPRLGQAARELHGLLHLGSRTASP